MKSSVDIPIQLPSSWVMWKSWKMIRAPRSELVLLVVLWKWWWLSWMWVLEFWSSWRIILEVETLAPWRRLTRLITNEHNNCLEMDLETGATILTSSFSCFSILKNNLVWMFVLIAPPLYWLEHHNICMI